MSSTLIDTIQEAESGSRDLDAEICIALQYGGENSAGAQNVRTDDEWEGDLLFEIGTEECCNPIPKLTTSLDAIVALIGEKIGGGYRIDHSDGPEGRADAWIWRPGNSGGGVHGEAWSAPIALCVALLTALQSQEPTP